MIDTIIAGCYIRSLPKQRITLFTGKADIAYIFNLLSKMQWGCSVADIISIDGKLDLTKNKKEALIRKRKIQAVQKVFQCTHCAFKCEKCGTQIEHATEETRKRSRDLRVPYNFCNACKEEYIDYIERLKGGGDLDCYWHNEAWIDAWKQWIDYQSSVDRYVKSKEFNQLLQEFKQTRPEK